MFDSGRYGITRQVLLWGLAAIGGLSLAGFVLTLVLAGTGRTAPEGSFLASIAAVLSRKGSISVAAEPATVPSGEAFHLSWVHETRRRGTYRLTIDCPPGVAVRQVNRDGTGCNTARGVGPDRFLVLSVTNRNPEPEEVRVSVTFEEEGVSAQGFFGGFTLVTVQPVSSPARTTTPPPPPPRISRTPAPPPAAGAAPVPTGPRLPDLAVRIIDVGTTTPEAQQFFPATRIRRSDVAAVLFEVSNVGNAPAPEWQFEAWLPIETSTFNSGTQPSLPVGGSVRFILGFSGLFTPGSFGPGGEFRVTMRVDPQGEVREANEENNSAVTTLPVVSD